MYFTGDIVDDDDDDELDVEEEDEEDSDENVGEQKTSSIKAKANPPNECQNQ